MTRAPSHERVWIDAERHHGEPCIKGTRIPVRVIIGSLADGMAPEEVIEAYPQLSKEDIQSALAYAADVLNQEVLMPLSTRTSRTPVRPFSVNGLMTPGQSGIKVWAAGRPRSYGKPSSVKASFSSRVTKVLPTPHPLHPERTKVYSCLGRTTTGLERCWICGLIAGMPSPVPGTVFPRRRGHHLQRNDMSLSESSFRACTWPATARRKGCRFRVSRYGSIGWSWPSIETARQPCQCSWPSRHR